MLNIEEIYGLYDIPVCLYKYNSDYFSEPDDGASNIDCIGLIAEDVEKINSKLVVYNNENQVEVWNQFQMIPSLLALIQNNHKDIKSLKSENQSLKNEVLMLQGQLSLITQRLQKLEEKLC